MNDDLDPKPLPSSAGTTSVQPSSNGPGAPSSPAPDDRLDGTAELHARPLAALLDAVTEPLRQPVIDAGQEPTEESDPLDEAHGLQRPRRKNPVLRTRQPTLPPWGRSRTALGRRPLRASGL
jgi:hypothetical protein